MAQCSPVYLVGAGPGDPELLTLKAMRLIQQADVVVYDRLVSQEIIAMIPPGATRIDVGKQPRQHPVPQVEINAMLVRLARKDRMVVRLKGGDPYTFGRGSEEALALVEQGVSCEVVPGITSASGCAAAAGIPLTHRGVATGVRYVTGHCRDNAALELDWDGLVDPKTTLVVYMAVANIRQIAARMMARGALPETPVAAIASGTTPQQKVILARLDGIADRLAEADLAGPVLFVIGQVVSLSMQIQGIDDGRQVERAALQHSLSG